MKNNDDASKAEAMISVKLAELEALYKKIHDVELKIMTWLKLQTDVNVSTANFTNETQKAMARFDETMKNILQTIEIHQYILSGEQGNEADDHGLDMNLPALNDEEKKLMN